MDSSQRNSSKHSGEKSKVSISDEKDVFKDSTTLEPKKPEKKKIKTNYFFMVAYQLGLWLAIAAIGAPFFWYFSAPQGDKPCYYGYGSIIGARPKLNIFPASYGDDKYIRVNKSLSDDDIKYLEDKFDFKYKYEGYDCKEDKTPEYDVRVNFSDGSFFGICNNSNLPENNYGLNNSCYLLQVNKILDYTPYPVSGDESEHCEDRRMKITCNDTEEYVEVFPKDGISICQWPYKSKDDCYHSPTAYLHVKKRPLDETVAIHCYFEKLKDAHENSGKDYPHLLEFKLDPEPADK